MKHPLLLSWHPPPVATERVAGDADLALPGAVLEITSGPDAGTAIPMAERTLRIGTAPDNDVVLRDASVSRHHAELQASAGGVWLVDLDSTNGTTIDGVRVARAALRDGSRITVGQTELRMVASDRPLRIPVSLRETFEGLRGKSLPMRELYATLERVAPTEASVLIHGETGAGKELVAEAIHEASPRANGPFVVVDCASITPALFESELFGHVRGSFTGAERDRKGLLVEAHGGTVFLDEIGELAPDLQPKLLRALERRQVRPVGAAKPLEIDVRVVAATHRDLAAEVNRGSFREDLYFRLAVIRVAVPPLRERLGDLPALIELFVTRLAPERIGEVPSLVEELRHRHFPGNVRELRNAVEERLVLTRPGDRAVRAVAAAASGRDTGSGGGLPETLYALPYQEASQHSLVSFQNEYVQRLLTRCAGNVSRAAREAGMSRRYLQAVISRLGLRAASDD